MSTREAINAKQSRTQKKEHIWVIVSIVISVLYVLWELKGLLQLSAATLHSRMFQHTFKDFGSNARIALFFVLANYVLILVVKLRVWVRLSIVKKWLVILLRFARRWHTPIAIIAIAFIILHAIAVFMYGFRFDFNNISGLLALLVLLPVPVSGLFRYKSLDRKWHLRSGLAFAVLFLIHAFL